MSEYTLELTFIVIVITSSIETLLSLCYAGISSGC